VVLRSFEGGVDPATRGADGVAFDREGILSVHEDRRATGEVRPMVGIRYHRYNLGGKPFLDDHVFEDAQNFRGARASFEVQEVYPHKAAVLINSLL
jgi:hypothetical protein